MVLQVSAQPADSIKKIDDSQTTIRAFANHLYVEGDYARAILEYKRYLYLINAKNDSISFTLGLCYQKLREYRTALEFFSQCADNNSIPELVEFSNTQIMYTHFLARDYTNCIKRIEQYTGGTSFKHDFLLIVCYALLNDWIQAEKKVTSMLPSKMTDQQKIIYTSLQNAVTEGKNVIYKSPLLSSFLSLIPGLGNIYNQRYGDGFFSLALVSSSYATAYLSAKKGQDAVALFFAAFALAFHAGNIFGTAVSTKNLNEKRLSKPAQGLLERAQTENWFPLLGLHMRHL